MNNFFLITGTNNLEVKNFAILTSKLLSKSCKQILVINFNNLFWNFFNLKHDKKNFEPQKFSLKEYFINVSDELFLNTEENQFFLKKNLKSLEMKFTNIIFIINKSNNWIYHFLINYKDIKKLELSNLNSISKSIELDILNKTDLPNFLISFSNFQSNSNDYYYLKKIYLNKIIFLNINLENEIENILLIPKKTYNEKTLKIIKNFLNVI